MCPICDGRACGNTIPGPGAKGIGDVAIRNYEKWKDIRVNMDVISDIAEPVSGIELFGYHLQLPLIAGPVGAVNLHYGDKYNDEEYNLKLIKACHDAGIIAMTGDGTDESVMRSACEAIKAYEGRGIPTVKPWDIDTLKNKFKLIKNSSAKAFAMDIDAAGLPFLKGRIPPAGHKTVDDLKEIASLGERPFIIKGIMTPKSAEKAVSAGASAIVVSNHGGRVLDQCLSTAEVLPEIVETVSGSCKVMVDGGIRDGLDIFKALAIGADAVLMARPFVNAIYQGGEQDAREMVARLESELKDAMSMCGAKEINDIDKSMVRIK